MLTENPIIDIPLIPSPKQQRQGRLNACTPASAAWADEAGIHALDVPVFIT